jgi:TRAP-type transport system periplasmic protein
MEKRKLFTLFLGMLLVLILAALPSMAAWAQATPVKKPTYNWKMSEPYAAPDLLYEGAVRIIKKADELSGGRMKIKLYPGDLLGDWTTQTENVARGEQALAIGTMTGTMDPRFNANWIIFLNYHKKSVEGMFRVGSWYYDILEPAYRKHNFKVLGYCNRGTNLGFASKKIFDPADTKGLGNIKLRTPGMEFLLKPWESIGFKVMGMPESEVAVAMQTGIIDARAMGNTELTYNELRDFTKAWYFIREWPNVKETFISQRIWETMPKEDQDILVKAVNYGMEYISDAAEETYEIKSVDKLEKAGITVIELSPAQWSRWAKIARNVQRPLIEKMVGKEIAEKFYNRADPLPIPDDSRPVDRIPREKFQSRWYENLVKAGKIKP